MTKWGDIRVQLLNNGAKWRLTTISSCANHTVQNGAALENEYEWLSWSEHQITPLTEVWEDICYENRSDDKLYSRIPEKKEFIRELTEERVEKSWIN